MMTLGQIGPARRLGALAAAAVIAAPAFLAAGPAAAADESLPDLVERVSPSVVTVMTQQQARMPGGMQMPDGGPLREFFERFGERFGMPDQSPEGEARPDDGRPEGRGPMRQGIGSGFVLADNGFVVTNAHVVDGADRVQVRLTDGRSYSAGIVGTDPETDLALLELEGAEGADLPGLELGDSDKVRVGEEVVAVGNPFGLGGTVTSGIISAAGRSMPGGTYVDFLQTDAAINRGNSGGPLFNMDGDVIGVNTSIFSPSGGSVGIGFAVPSNIVAHVVEDLKDDGQVARGWLGVRIQGVTPDIADAIGLDEARGALVASVQDGAPAEGSLESGDVILGYDGRTVETSRDLPLLVGRTQPGTDVEVEVFRDGERMTVSLEVGTLDDRQRAEADRTPMPRTAETTSEVLGARLAAAEGREGAVVSGIEPGSRAERAGLRPGDVILEVGGNPVTGPRSLEERIADMDADSALFLVERGGDRLFVGVNLAS